MVPTGLDLAAALEGGDGNGGTRLRKGPVSLLFPIEVQIRTGVCAAVMGGPLEMWTGVQA